MVSDWIAYQPAASFSGGHGRSHPPPWTSPIGSSRDSLSHPARTAPSRTLPSPSATMGTPSASDLPRISCTASPARLTCTVSDDSVKSIRKHARLDPDPDDVSAREVILELRDRHLRRLGHPRLGLEQRPHQKRHGRHGQWDEGLDHVRSQRRAGRPQDRAQLDARLPSRANGDGATIREIAGIPHRDPIVAGRKGIACPGGVAKRYHPGPLEDGDRRTGPHRLPAPQGSRGPRARARKARRC